jgi:hypothetical protein
VTFREALTMADGWGQINDGSPYHVITVDLDRAIAHLGLTRYESMLLQYVREQSWGTQARTKGRNEPWPDPVPACVNAADLAREWGVPRQRVSQAKWTLINRNVLIEDGDRLTINKNASTWLGLSPASHAYCRKPVSMDRTQNRAPGKPALMDDRTEKCADPAQNSVRSPHGIVCGPTNKDRVRVPEDSEEKEEKTPRTPPTASPVTEKTDPEIDRVAKLCDRLDPYANGAWAQKVHQFAAMYPPAWILAACEAAAAAGKGDWRYVHRILQRYQQQGGPDVAPAGREPLTVARPEPPMPPRHIPEPEMTPEERAEYAKRFRLIVQGAAHAG